jgi:hypothetical protein
LYLSILQFNSLLIAKGNFSPETLPMADKPQEVQDPTSANSLLEQWKHNGVQVIPGGTLDSNTAQTPGT